MKRSNTNPARCLVLLLTLTMTAAFSSVALAQSSPRVDARALNWQRLHTPITVEFDENRLEDVMMFVRDFSGADLEPLWSDERRGGLDKDAPVTLSVEDATVIALLERVLEQVQDDFDQNTWQFSRAGAFEMGPKSRLNRKAYLKAYDVNDLLYQSPNFPEVPRLDLDQILNQSQQGGGGGGGSIFSEEDVDEEDGPTRDELIDRLENLILTTVEPDQWVETAGDGASIDRYDGTLLIRAPAYIHRQIVAPSFMRRAPSPAEPPTRLTTRNPDAPAR